MSFRVAAVARPAVALGLGLAGLEADGVASAAGAAARVGARLAEPGVGVVLVEEELLAALPEALLREARRRPLPLLLSLPSPSLRRGAATPEEQVVEILRQAIGYRVRLQ